jgi:DNA-binding NarL/FixJ family response regulator
MSKIRVFLGLSSVNKIHSLKKQLLRDPEIEIVGEAINNLEILLKVGNTHAEVVAVDLPLSEDDAGITSHLLEEYPQVKVFAISEEEARIILYGTAKIRKEIQQGNLEKLIDLIHQSVSYVNVNDNDLQTLW